MNTVLSVRGVSKRYRLGTKVPRDIWALRGVTFDVARGTILGVIGANGAGKTTLLKVISRVTPPTKGRVLGRGRVVPLLALGAGFQADLSARENVYLNAAMYGIPASDVDRRMDDIVEFAGLGDFLDVTVKRFSSGMYLRLAFSVAINMEPDILLADEVLAVGDLEFQERCLERVRQAGEAGMAVLFVSHDMEAIRRLCHQVLWLNAGEIVKIGPADAVTAEYESASWALATKASSRKRGSHTNAGVEILFTRLTSTTGKEIGAVRVVDEFSIQVGYRIKQPGLTVRPQLDVYARGALAFRTVLPAAEQPEPGDYMAAVTVPPHLMADTVYTCETHLSASDGDRILNVVQHNSLAFQCLDTVEGASARGTFSGKMAGVVQPKLDWTVRPLASAARTPSAD